MPFLKRFSNLQWKLTISYVGVTLLTVLALEIVVILAMSCFGAWAVNTWVVQSVLYQAQQLADLAAEPLESGSVDQLTQVLDQSVGVVVKFMTVEDDGTGGDVTRWISEARVVIGPQGDVVTSNQPGYYPVGEPFVELGLLEAESLVVEALAGGVAGSYLAEEPGVVAVAVPITNVDGEQLGVLYCRQPTLNTTFWSLGNLAKPLLVTTLVLLPCMIPLGLIFGFVTATGATRRLRRLSEASGALADGDLSRRVQDTSEDEIGQLAWQFNAMAEQLEIDTAQLRELANRNARLAQQAQRLAALEERHQLARDLHDGVKQHLFGVKLATSAALNLLDKDPEAAHARLLEAGEHSRQAQAEMQALLDELRPPALDERGLIAALTDHLTIFERQTDIEVCWDAGDALSLPLTHEQALFRVAQEAMANIARHAQATQVMVELHTTSETVELQVVDDGKGFDLSAVEAETTMGLRNMRERLAKLGGTLTVDAAPGAGTRLVARLPHSAETAEGGSHG